MRYFNIYSNVLVTKGHTRMIINDLQRNISEIYPLELYYLLEELKKDSLEKVFETYDKNAQEVLTAYTDLLLEKEYGFITNNDWDKNFPPISYDYQDPTILSNIVIEFQSIGVLYKIKDSIDNLRISHLLIHSRRNLSMEDFKEIDTCFKNSCLEGIEIYSPHYDAVNEEFIKYLNNNTTRIYNLVFFNSNNYELEKSEKPYRFTIHFTPKDLVSKSCGIVDLKYFSTNIIKVMEAINHNSCLHKKIAIDQNGDIRNCPSMPQSFGNIKDTTLEEAVNKPSFKKYWNITKDLIDVCKDCEFRYICTDCRAYKEDPNNDFSKPLKCGYNPYTAQWEEWSTNPLKQKAINFYDMKEFVKKQTIY